MVKELDPRRQRLKEEFTKARGYWSELWEAVLEMTPEFFEAYVNFSAVPWRNGVLSAKVKEFVYIAIDASTTHLYEPGLKLHIDNAIRHGASQEEILEVIQLTCVLGIDTALLGVPVLLDELKCVGRDTAVTTKPLTERQEALKRELEEQRGYWSNVWDDILQLDPDFFEASLRFSSVPWKLGVLEPKIRELIYIAINASTTHLYEPGLRLHIRNAIKYGATIAEIMEVYELTSVLGIHAVTMGVPCVIKAFVKAKGNN